MPGPFAIDASVFINAFIETEAGHAESRDFLAHLQAEAVPIIAPTLLLPESAAAISRGHQDAELGRKFALALSRLPHLVLVSLDEKLALQSSDVAAHNRLRGSDAVYAAVVLRFGCPLVTLDREQHDRVSALLTVLYPVEALQGF